MRSCLALRAGGFMRRRTRHGGAANAHHPPPATGQADRHLRHYRVILHFGS